VIPGLCQRWRAGRESYRPSREPLDPTRFAVDGISEKVAKAFVVEHHYSGSYPAARVRVGLFRGHDLVGVAVFAEPAQRATIPRYAPGATDGVVLARFVLLDEVEANAETWFLARAFRGLGGLDAVVSYSDPVRRTASDGRVVLPGHVGTIYQAFNGRYLGRSRAELLHLGPDGRVVSRRGLSKLRNDERGADGVYRALLALGAPARRPLEDGPAYVARALAEGPFRRLRHPGNHVYAWPLRRGVVIAPSAGSYPKHDLFGSPA
jgi:hypothetical protein